MKPLINKKPIAGLIRGAVIEVAATMAPVLPLMIALLFLAGTASAKGPAEFTRGDRIQGVASVIDGDTIEIHGTRIRLWGIDAPESDQTCELGAVPMRCGAKSAAALDGLIGRQSVDCRVVDVDRWGRAVAECFANRKNLNEAMVREGWALDWPRYSKGRYGAAQAQAQRENRGVWATIFMEPWKWRQLGRAGR